MKMLVRVTSASSAAATTCLAENVEVKFTGIPSASRSRAIRSDCGSCGRNGTLTKQEGTMARSARPSAFAVCGSLSAPMCSWRLTSQARPAPNALAASLPIQPETIV